MPLSAKLHEFQNLTPQQWLDLQWMEKWDGAVPDTLIGDQEGTELILPAPGQ